MKKVMLFAALAIVGVALLSATPAQAALLRLDIQPNGYTTGQANGFDSDAAVTQGFSNFGNSGSNIWDIRPCPGGTVTFSSLRDTASGAATGYSITMTGLSTGQGDNGTGCIDIGLGLVNAELNNTVTFNGLTPNVPVEVIAYGMGNVTPAILTGLPGQGATTYWQPTSSNGLDPRNNGGGYDWHISFTPTSSSATGTWTPPAYTYYDVLYLSGLQIYQAEAAAAVPEPAGLGLIGIALLALRKRRS